MFEAEIQDLKLNSTAE